MITTGKYFEKIVEMLNYFKAEVQTFSALGLTNINKHSENFLKRLLNITYDYELENLNVGKSNYPGLDLGDIDEGIAFQITSTRKSGKIDETLITCLSHKHYNAFKQINIFILTNKQSSYSLKTITEPHFLFSVENNIKDFDDLFKDIEHLSPVKMKAIHDYIKSELNPVIESIREDKSFDEKFSLDTNSALQESGMPTYGIWQSKVVLKTEQLSVPKIHSALNNLLVNPVIKNQLFSIFNNAFLKNHSNKQVEYIQNLKKTNVQNYFFGNAIILKPSSIIIEKADYTDGDILSDLYSEMLMLITCILFFSKQATEIFEIEVSVIMETNGTVYFHPTKSIVLDNLFNSFSLDSPFNISQTIRDIHTPTLADLLQDVMHGFICNGQNFLNNEPFININRKSTEFIINNIKIELGI